MDNTLRGAVLTKFRSISDFARAMEWDRKKASRIVNRVQDPTISDIEKMTPALGINDCVTFCNVFVPQISTLEK